MLGPMLRLIAFFESRGNVQCPRHVNPKLEALTMISLGVLSHGLFVGNKGS